MNRAAADPAREARGRERDAFGPRGLRQQQQQREREEQLALAREAEREREREREAAERAERERTPSRKPSKSVKSTTEVNGRQGSGGTSYAKSQSGGELSLFGRL